MRHKRTENAANQANATQHKRPESFGKLCADSFALHRFHVCRIHGTPFDRENDVETEGTQF